MPNHVNGIIRITSRGELHSPAGAGEMVFRDGGIRGECNSPLSGPSQTVGAIIRGYKSSVTKKLNALGIGCVVWQRDYYDIIIRDDQLYQRISDYIVDNPAKWKDDKFFRK